MARKIMIIGASSGIGRRLAERYAEKNHRIGISGRREELLKQIQQQHPQNIEYEAFDVRESDNFMHLESLRDKIGGLDLLIICAGIGEPDKELVWEYDLLTVETNVDGFVSIANWGFNQFVKQGFGHLVNISSVAANRGGHHAPAYNASKAFQSSYLEGLSIKAHKMKKQVYITSVEPGFVATKMSKSNRIFWLVPVDKAARQIQHAVEHKRRKVYISKRWWLVAKIMRWMPYWLYRRI